MIVRYPGAVVGNAESRKRRIASANRVGIRKAHVEIAQYPKRAFDANHRVVITGIGLVLITRRAGNIGAIVRGHGAKVGVRIGDRGSGQWQRCQPD